MALHEANALLTTEMLAISRPCHGGAWRRACSGVVPEALIKNGAGAFGLNSHGRMRIFLQSELRGRAKQKTKPLWAVFVQRLLCQLCAAGHPVV